MPCEVVVPPPVAEQVFGSRLDLAVRYASWLGSAGIERGLLGPQEPSRLWERHLINCAVVADLLPMGSRVVDVGSGAGLPGVVFACRRPDLRVDLVESTRRRAAFLVETVTRLALDNSVRVVEGRAEDQAVVAQVGEAAWVTARAVAPLGRLVRWCLPLLRPGGSLLAIKGARAAAEVTEHRVALRRAGAGSITIEQCGGQFGEEATVVVVRRGAVPQRGRKEREH